jgi:DNA-binding MarR family transcriptional regulator
MDRSTLSRNLKPLLEGNLVGTREAEDRRRKMIALTAKGRRVLARAYPLWLDAQARFTAAYGESESSALTQLLMRATTVRA